MWFCLFSWFGSHIDPGLFTWPYPWFSSMNLTRSMFDEKASVRSSANSSHCIALRTLSAPRPRDHSCPEFFVAGIEDLNEGVQRLRKCFSNPPWYFVFEKHPFIDHCLLFTIWNQSCRVGEAANPGPAASSLGQDILNIGALNTTGIYDKHDQISSLGKGIWSICETHATLRTQKIFSQKMKPNFNCAYTRPVKSIGAASGYRGVASGVACVTPLPIRTLRTGIPETVHDSCRLLVNHITVNSSTTILVVSVYGPATGIATIADPQQLLQDLLNTAISTASQWNGPAVILGDFNTDPEQYSPIQTLLRHGWVDAHLESHRQHGHPLHPTCILAHGTSRHSRIYINPQCARSFVRCETWNDNLFPGHPALVLQCQLSTMTQRLATWQLPKSFDSYCIDPVAASAYETHCSQLQRHFQESLDGGDLEQASKIWTIMCEKTLAFSARDSQQQIARINKSHFGRSDGPKLKSNPPSLPSVRDGRDGDFNPGWGQCTLHLRQVCRQARRIANLVHLCRARKRNPNPVNESTCVQLWTAICQAPGFPKSFPQWYVEFAHEPYPLEIPDIDELVRIQSIFKGYCDKMSNTHRNHVKETTKEFFNEDWNKGGAKTFARVKEDPLPNPPFVVQTLKSKVKRVVWKKTGSKVLNIDDPQIFAVGDQIVFQGQNATVVNIQENTIRVDTILFLRNQDHSIRIKKYIYEPREANRCVTEAWNGFFQKDRNTPIDSWKEVEDILPQLPQSQVADLPNLEVEVWKRVHSSISQKSARGPCGFSVHEMRHLPDWILELLFKVFQAIHDGKPWPQLWVKAFTVLLPKTDDPQALIDNRPITILSRVYRMWSRFFSITLLVQLSNTVPKTIGGGTKEVSALMMTSYVQELLESHQHNRVFAAGLVIDLVKCFNTIPRYPLALFMSKAGWPHFLIQSYLRALHQMQRSFVILGNASPWHETYTGIPEGCPLAVPAMLTMSITAYHFVRVNNPSIEFQAFADNWAMLFSDIDQVAHGVKLMEQFCNILKLQVSVPKSWLWSLNRKGEEKINSLTLQGSVIPVVTEAKDLGVDISYGKGKNKKHLQKRLSLGLTRLDKLKTAKIPTKRRTQVLKNGCFAKATYGAELQMLTKDIFNKYRIASSRALGRGRAGASPWLSLSLVDRIVDFEHGELERKFFFWRRFLRIFPTRLHDICSKLESPQPTKGPVGAFRKTVQKFFTWGPGGSIVSEWFGNINWLQCSKRYLKYVIQVHWNCYCCQQLAHRKAFHATAIDNVSFSKALLQIPTHHQNAIVVHACGTHFANDALSHFDGSSNLCPYCGALDSTEHRLLYCPMFASQRVSTFGRDDISSQIDDPTMRHFAILAIPSDVLKMRKKLEGSITINPPPPQDHTKLTLFTDGSCCFPKQRLFSLAGSAVIVARTATAMFDNLNRSLLPGCDHTPHRAEIFGVILALEACLVLEIWCDCAAVVGDFNTMVMYLQQGITWVPSDHTDLWDIVLTLIRDRSNLVKCVKTKGHVCITEGMTPQQIWEAKLNSEVDKQAKQAIMVDHPELYQEFLQAYTQHNEKRQLHSKVVKCQSQIIQKTFSLRKKINRNDEGNTDNDPANPHYDATMQWDIPLVLDDCNYCVYTPLFMYRICTWAQTLRWEIQGSGETSFLELFLQFSFDTNTMAPSNAINSPRWDLYDQYPTKDSSGFLLSHNYLNFGKAIRWIEKKFGYVIFPNERRTHSNALRPFGWRGAMWGVQRRVILSYRDKINSFLRPLNLYRSKSLEVAFTNPTPNSGERAQEQLMQFVSPQDAYRNSQSRGVFRNPAV